MHAYFASNVTIRLHIVVSLDSLDPMREWYKSVAHCSLSGECILCEFAIALNIFLHSTVFGQILIYFSQTLVDFPEKWR